MGQFHRRGTTGRDAAKNAFHSNPEDIVFDAKRLIGRKVDDPEVKRDQKHWPFSIVSKNDKPAIQVKYRGETRDFVRRVCFHVDWRLNIFCSHLKKSQLWSLAR